MKIRKDYTIMPLRPLRPVQPDGRRTDYVELILALVCFGSAAALMYLLFAP